MNVNFIYIIILSETNRFRFSTTLPKIGSSEVAITNFTCSVSSYQQDQGCNCTVLDVISVQPLDLGTIVPPTDAAEVTKLQEHSTDSASNSRTVSTSLNSVQKVESSVLTSQNKSNIITAKPSVGQFRKKPTKMLANCENKYRIKLIEVVSIVIQYVNPDNWTKAWAIPTDLENVYLKLLEEINNKITVASPRVAENDIIASRLVAVLFEGVYYRARILAKVNPLNEVLVRLIDYGNEFYAKLEDIRQPIPVIVSLNAFAFEIKIQGNRQVEAGDYLNVNILSNLNGAYIVEDIDSTLYASSIITPAPQIYSLSDIHTVPIPETGICELYCFDFSEINDGYIIAGIYDVPAIQMLEEEMPLKMPIYCNSITTGYMPKVGELCLAIYDEDMDWYRTVCVGIENDQFSLLFIHYGNITKSSSRNIRPIVKEFMYPCLANTCFIEGISFFLIFLLSFS